ncbi:MAG TPA: pseudouridine synthase [Verrucomicrobiae bacterium]|nr:pseudouridine synthase [Verrucomicrobiae bacterium]
MIARRARKIISLGIMLSMLCGDLARADPLAFSPRPENIPAFELSLPSELGRYGDSFFPSGEKMPFIFHLQTAHGSPEAALKIEEIIRYLEKTYHVKLLFAEGASESLHPEYLRFFPSEEPNEKMVRMLAETGELTGVDLALPKSKLTALGVEQPVFYRPAFKLFKKVVASLDRSKAVLDARERELDLRASKIFSPDFRALVTAWQKHQEQQRDLAATARLLRDEARKILNLDLANPFSQFDWPQLTRLVMLQELEQRKNPEALEREKEKLGAWLAAKKLPADILAALGSKDLKQPREFYEQFLVKAHPQGFRFKTYPQIMYRAASQSLENEMSAGPLFAEIDSLFDALFKARAGKEDLALLDAYRDLALRKKLVSLELTREEWKKAKEKIKSAPAPLAAAFRQAGAFYHLAEIREAYFYKKIRREMKIRNQKVAILVTGGFHQDGMARVFRGGGMGYAAIQPRISGEISSASYLAAMTAASHLEKPEFAHPAGLGDRAFYAGELRRFREALRQAGLNTPVSSAWLADRQKFLQRAELRVSYKAKDWSQDSEWLHRKRMQERRGYQSAVYQVFARAGLEEGTSILELGAGAHETLKQLSPADLSRGWVTLDNGNFRTGKAQVSSRAEKTPFADSSFGAVTGLEFFDILDNLDAVLAETARLLKPGQPLIAMGDFPSYASPALLNAVERERRRLGIRGKIFVPRFLDDAGTPIAFQWGALSAADAARFRKESRYRALAAELYRQNRAWRTEAIEPNFFQLLAAYMQDLLAPLGFRSFDRGQFKVSEAPFGPRLNYFIARKKTGLETPVGPTGKKAELRSTERAAVSAENMPALLAAFDGFLARFEQPEHAEVYGEILHEVFLRRHPRKSDLAPKAQLSFLMEVLPYGKFKQDTRFETIRDLVIHAFERTGEDLLRSAMLKSFSRDQGGEPAWRFDGAPGLLPVLETYHTLKDAEDRNYRTSLLGQGLRVFMPAEEYDAAWKASNWALAPYYPSSDPRHAGDPFSSLMKQLTVNKNPGPISKLIPLLRAPAEEVPWHDADVVVPAPYEEQNAYVGWLIETLRKTLGDKWVPAINRKILRKIEAREKQKSQFDGETRTPSAVKRALNAAGNFEVPPEEIEAIRGKTVVLFDDNWTTGFTADEARRVLLDAGAARVMVVVAGKSEEEALHALERGQIEAVQSQPGELVASTPKKAAVPARVPQAPGPRGQTGAAPFQYFAMYKPQGAISTRSDNSRLRRRTIYDLFAQATHLNPLDYITLGRLDADVDGLVVLTNDPSMVSIVMPVGHVEKHYYVTVEGTITPEQVHRLEEGVDIETKDQFNKPLTYHTRPARVENVSPGPKTSVLHLYISEGKYHQVKLMLEAVGHKVIYLTRLGIGGIELEDEDLSPGRVMPLTPASLGKLMAARQNALHALAQLEDEKPGKAAHHYISVSEFDLRSIADFSREKLLAMAASEKKRPYVIRELIWDLDRSSGLRQSFVFSLLNAISADHPHEVLHAVVSALNTSPVPDKLKSVLLLIGLNSKSNARQILGDIQQRVLATSGRGTVYGILAEVLEKLKPELRASSAEGILSAGVTGARPELRASSMRTELRTDQSPGLPEFPWLTDPSQVPPGFATFAGILKDYAASKHLAEAEDLTTEAILAWMVDQPVVDLGQAPYAAFVEWLRQRGSRQAVGISPSLSKRVRHAPYLYIMPWHGYMPLKEGSTRLFLSYVMSPDYPPVPQLLHKGEEVSYLGMLAQMEKALSHHGLILLDTRAFDKDRLEAALKHHPDLHTEKAGNYLFLARKSPSLVLEQIVREVRHAGKAAAARDAFETRLLAHLRLPQNAVRELDVNFLREPGGIEKDVAESGRGDVLFRLRGLASYKYDALADDASAAVDETQRRNLEDLPSPYLAGDLFRRILVPAFAKKLQAMAGPEQVVALTDEGQLMTLLLGLLKDATRRGNRLDLDLPLYVFFHREEKTGHPEIHVFNAANGDARLTDRAVETGLPDWSATSDTRQDDLAAMRAALASRLSKLNMAMLPGGGNGVSLSFVTREAPKAELRSTENAAAQAPAYHYFALFKPRFVLSTRFDEDGDRKTIYDIFAEKSGRNPADYIALGRLDYDVDGLMILTDDPSMLSIVMPTGHVEKRYYVTVKGRLTPEEADRLRTGVEIDTKDHHEARIKYHTKPARVENIQVNPTDGTTTLSLYLKEGKYHQVKAMMEAVGHPVMRLSRTGMADIEMRELHLPHPGWVELLTPIAVQKLTEARDKALHDFAEEEVQRPGKAAHDYITMATFDLAAAADYAREKLLAMARSGKKRPFVLDEAAHELLRPGERAMFAAGLINTLAESYAKETFDALIKQVSRLDNVTPPLEAALRLILDNPKIPKGPMLVGKLRDQVIAASGRGEFFIFLTELLKSKSELRAEAGDEMRDVKQDIAMLEAKLRPIVEKLRGSPFSRQWPGLEEDLEMALAALNNARNRIDAGNWMTASNQLAIVWERVAQSADLLRQASPDLMLMWDIDTLLSDFVEAMRGKSLPALINAALYPVSYHLENGHKHLQLGFTLRTPPAEPTDKSRALEREAEELHHGVLLTHGMILEEQDWTRGVGGILDTIHDVRVRTEALRNRVKALTPAEINPNSRLVLIGESGHYYEALQKLEKLEEIIRERWVDEDPEEDRAELRATANPPQRSARNVLNAGARARFREAVFLVDEGSISHPTVQSLPFLELKKLFPALEKVIIPRGYLEILDLGVPAEVADENRIRELLRESRGRSDLIVINASDRFTSLIPWGTQYPVLSSNQYGIALRTGSEELKLPAFNHELPDYGERVRLLKTLGLRELPSRPPVITEDRLSANVKGERALLAEKIKQHLVSQGLIGRGEIPDVPILYVNPFVRGGTTGRWRNLPDLADILKDMIRHFPGLIVINEGHLPAQAGDDEPPFGYAQELYAMLRREILESPDLGEPYLSKLVSFGPNDHVKLAAALSLADAVLTVHTGLTHLSEAMNVTGITVSSPGMMDSFKRFFYKRPRHIFVTNGKVSLGPMLDALMRGSLWDVFWMKVRLWLEARGWMQKTPPQVRPITHWRNSHIAQEFERPELRTMETERYYQMIDERIHALYQSRDTELVSHFSRVGVIGKTPFSTIASVLLHEFNLANDRENPEGAYQAAYDALRRTYQAGNRGEDLPGRPEQYFQLIRYARSAEGVAFSRLSGRVYAYLQLKGGGLVGKRSTPAMKNADAGANAAPILYLAHDPMPYLTQILNSGRKIVTVDNDEFTSGVMNGLREYLGREQDMRHVIDNLFTFDTVPVKPGTIYLENFGAYMKFSDAPADLVPETLKTPDADRRDDVHYQAWYDGWRKVWTGVIRRWLRDSTPGVEFVLQFPAGETQSEKDHRPILDAFDEVLKAEGYRHFAGRFDSFDGTFVPGIPQAGAESSLERNLVTHLFSRTFPDARETVDAMIKEIKRGNAPEEAARDYMPGYARIGDTPWDGSGTPPGDSKPGKILQAKQHLDKTGAAAPERETVLALLDVLEHHPEADKLTLLQFEAVAQQIVHRYSGVPDAYASYKQELDKAFLNVYPALRERVFQSADPKEQLWTALLYAGIGNLIDPSHPDAMKKAGINAGLDLAGQMAEVFGRITSENLALGKEGFESFFRQLQAAEKKTVLYFLDNHGEFVMDQLVIEWLLRQGFKVAVVAKNGVIRDDVTEDEAAAGLRGNPLLAPYLESGRLSVITDGSTMLGADLSKGGLHDAFMEAWEDGVAVIAKGAGSWHTLPGQKLSLPLLHLRMMKSSQPAYARLAQLTGQPPVAPHPLHLLFYFQPAAFERPAQQHAELRTSSHELVAEKTLGTGRSELRSLPEPLERTLAAALAELKPINPEVLAKYHLSAADVRIGTFRDLLREWIEAGFFDYGDIDELTRLNNHDRGYAFLGDALAAPEAFRKTLTRLWELKQKYGGFIAALNEKMREHPGINGRLQAEGIVFSIDDDADNPMRWDEDRQRIVLNLRNLLEEANDVHGLGSAAHEIGHGLLALMDAGASGPEEAREIAANWAAFQIAGRDAMEEMINAHVRLKLAKEGRLYAHSAGHLAAFAREAGIPLHDARAAGFAGEGLIGAYARFYRGLSWRTELRTETDAALLEKAYALLKEIPFIKETRGFGIDDLNFSKAMMDEILKHPIQHALVAGSGMRMLPLLLALLGREVTFVEMDPLRIKEAVRDWEEVRDVLKNRDAAGLKLDFQIQTIESEFGALDVKRLGLAGKMDLVTLVDLSGGPSVQGDAAEWMDNIAGLLKPTGGYAVVDRERKNVNKLFDAKFPEKKRPLLHEKPFQGVFNFAAMLPASNYFFRIDFNKTELRMLDYLEDHPRDAQKHLRKILALMDDVREPQAAWQIWLEPAVRFWITTPPPELSRQEIGRQLHAYWRKRGWDRVFDLTTKIIQMDVSPLDQVAQTERLALLASGSLQERVLRDWILGVAMSLHIRWFGNHMDPGGVRPADNEILAGAARRFLAEWIEQQDLRKSSEPLLSPRFKGTRPAAAQDDLMLWGLALMLDPILHDFKASYKAEQNTERGGIFWKTPREAVLEYMGRMLKGLHYFDENGSETSRAVPAERLRGILAQVLSMTEADWAAKGLRDPAKVMHTSMGNYIRLIENAEPALPFLVPMFNLALPEVERLPFDTNVKENLMAVRRERYDITQKIVTAKYGPRRDMAQRMVFLTWPEMEKIVPGLKALFQAGHAALFAETGDYAARFQLSELRSAEGGGEPVLNEYEWGAHRVLAMGGMHGYAGDRRMLEKFQKEILPRIENPGEWLFLIEGWDWPASAINETPELKAAVDHARPNGIVVEDPIAPIDAPPILRAVAAGYENAQDVLRDMAGMNLLDRFAMTGKEVSFETPLPEVVSAATAFGLDPQALNARMKELFDWVTNDGESYYRTHEEYLERATQISNAVSRKYFEHVLASDAARSKKYVFVMTGRDHTEVFDPARPQASDETIQSIFQTFLLVKSIKARRRAELRTGSLEPVTETTLRTRRAELRPDSLESGTEKALLARSSELRPPEEDYKVFQENGGVRVSITIRLASGPDGDLWIAGERFPRDLPGIRPEAAMARGIREAMKGGTSRAHFTGLQKAGDKAQIDVILEPKKIRIESEAGRFHYEWDDAQQEFRTLSQDKRPLNPDDRDFFFSLANFADNLASGRVTKYDAQGRLTEVADYSGSVWERYSYAADGETHVFLGNLAGQEEVELRVHHGSLADGAQTYSAQVTVAGEKADSFSWTENLPRAGERKVYRLFNFYPLGQPGSPMYKRYAGHGVGETALNWLVGRASRERAEFLNSGTPHLPLLALYRKTFADQMPAIHGRWSDYEDLIKTHGFYGAAVIGKAGLIKDPRRGWNAQVDIEGGPNLGEPLDSLVVLTLKLERRENGKEVYHVAAAEFPASGGPGLDSMADLRSEVSVSIDSRGQVRGEKSGKDFGTLVETSGLNYVRGTPKWLAPRIASDGSIVLYQRGLPRISTHEEFSEAHSELRDLLNSRGTIAIDEERAFALAAPFGGRALKFAFAAAGAQGIAGVRDTGAAYRRYLEQLVLDGLSPDEKDAVVWRAVSPASLLAANGAAETSPARILRLYGRMPRAEEAELQVLADYAALHPQAMIVLAAPGAEGDRRDLENALRVEILRRRAEKADTAKGVNLLVLAPGDAGLSRFQTAGESRFLVYADDAGRLGQIRQSWPSETRPETLFVHEDLPDGSGSRLKEASALLAALGELDSPEPLPQVILSAADLLTRHAELLHQVQALFDSAA